MHVWDLCKDRVRAVCIEHVGYRFNPSAGAITDYSQSTKDVDP